ncbi:hypothetical protein LZF95_17065 [Algoriphagus sp. AGSA1]|uniref:hypothetical protein n=1 Tax=Algoriphagus sp. AGSA1 TaxID=2907213 RepID=UPI001F3C190F|nr:hypothetical protein [Algoriphagus sp. AGSA1]MCE7056397.1 hypothetical protein [Algoriphagus sp. AGSA1]
MESIRKLLDTCSFPERIQLIEFAKIKNAPSSKKLMLLKLFVHQPDLSDSEYAQKIYKKQDAAAYFQLKKRVKDELKELLLLLKPPCVDKTYQLYLSCSELLLKSQHILVRGVRGEGAKMLEKVLKMAIKYNFHDLIWTIYTTAVRFGIVEVLNTNDLPELELAINGHLQLLIKQNPCSKKSPKASKNKYLKSMIKKLNHSLESWNKLNIIRNAIQQREYDHALSIIDQANSEWKPGLQLYCKEGLKLLKMSVFLAKREYDKVLEESVEVMQTTHFSKENKLNFTLTHWYALFHLDKIEDARHVLHNELIQLDTSQMSKWMYLDMHLNYKLMDFKNALKQIHQNQNTLKCLPDYYLGSKMLEIMILFDLNDTDWLEYKIENFRKLIARTTFVVNKRIQSSFCLFTKLQKSLYNPDHNQIHQHPALHELQNETKGVEWDPASFELIRYDTWIKGKLAARLYGIIESV